MGLYFHREQFVPVSRSLELYFEGCDIHCTDCQNPELWVKTKDSLIQPQELIKKLLIYRDIQKDVHILGGEPTLQEESSMSEFLLELKVAGFKNIIFFTGKNLSVEDYSYFRFCDYIKTGPYVCGLESYIEPVLGLTLASNNQKIIKVNI